MACLHFVFNYLNTTNDYRSFRFWASISQEAPLANRRPGEVVGWSPEENNKFWAAEKKFNRIWDRTWNVTFVVLGVVFNIGLFIDRYEVDVYTYVTMQAIHLAHNV